MHQNLILIYLYWFLMSMLLFLFSFWHCYTENAYKNCLRIRDFYRSSENPENVLHIFMHIARQRTTLSITTKHEIYTVFDIHLHSTVNCIKFVCQFACMFIINSWSTFKNYHFVFSFIVASWQTGIFSCLVIAIINNTIYSYSSISLFRYRD